MKKVISLFAISALFVGSAMAADLSLEGRFANAGSSVEPNSTEYVVAVSTALPAPGLLGQVVVGGELQAKEYAGSSALTSVAAAHVATSVSYLGFSATPAVELGRFAVADESTNFWGAGVTVSHAVLGPVSAEVGYRHRESVTSTKLMDENRVSGALVLALNKKSSLAATFYHNTGTLPENQVGVGYRYSF